MQTISSLYRSDLVAVQRSPFGVVTLEPPQFPCGGIAAVTGRLPDAMQGRYEGVVFAIAPFHRHSQKMKSIQTEKIGVVSIVHRGSPCSVAILRRIDTPSGSATWYFLQPAEATLFAGERHPYDMPADRLLEDALAFGNAVRAALPFIVGESSSVLFLQDWQAAATALALSSDASGRHACVLTLHNGYDASCSDDALRAAGIEPTRCPGPPGTTKPTILERALRLVARPVLTVSQQFGSDMSEEVIQRVVLASHLQDALRNNLVGVDNGPFAANSVPLQASRAARNGDYASVAEWKAVRRLAFLKALDEHVPTPDKPIWGDRDSFDRDPDAVWFVMGGRDDPRQKGFDVFASAIDAFLKKGGNARFILFPMPGDEGDNGLRFLQKLADAHPTRVLVLPFRFDAGYMAALQGTDFGVMSSLYEPFGAANEMALLGAVCIARATGGLLQQIVPWRGCASFSAAAEQRTRVWFDAAAKPTGLIIREPNDLPTVNADWRAINRADYKTDGTAPDRVEGRERLPLFQAIVRELRGAIEDAVNLRMSNPEFYFQMLLEGVEHIERNFSWNRSAEAYVRIGRVQSS